MWEVSILSLFFESDGEVAADRLTVVLNPTFCGQHWSWLTSNDNYFLLCIVLL